jgi:hypothetical protein
MPILGHEKDLLELLRQAKLPAYGSRYDVRMPLTITAIESQIDRAALACAFMRNSKDGLQLKISRSSLQQI